MKSESHLTLQTIPLVAGKEWVTRGRSWRVLRLSRGEAYYLGAAGPRALAEGELLVLAPGAEGLIRASRIGDAMVHGFSFVPGRLNGVLDVEDQRYFQRLARVGFAVRFYPGEHV